MRGLVPPCFAGSGVSFFFCPLFSLCAIFAVGLLTELVVLAPTLAWFSPWFCLQIPPAIEQRGVFYKQSQAGFYPTSCEVVADTLVNTVLTVRTDGWRDVRSYRRRPTGG